VSTWGIQAPHLSVQLVPQNPDKWQEFSYHLERFPGPRQRRGRTLIPLNSLAYVMHWMAQYEVSWLSPRWEYPVPPPAPGLDCVGQLVTAAGAKPWVWSAFLSRVQKAAILWGWGKPGVSFWHPTGSGKTVVAALTALAHPGSILVVTRSTLRIQYSRELSRFLDHEPHVIRTPAEPYPVRVQGQSYAQFRRENAGQGWSVSDFGQKWKERKAECGVDEPETLTEYQERVAHRGQRAIFVTGWETLALLWPSLSRLTFAVVIFDEAQLGKNSKRWAVEHLGDICDTSEGYSKEQATAKEEGGFLKKTPEGWKRFLPTKSRSYYARLLAGRATRARIATTATPVGDRVRDLYAQLDLVEPGAWGTASAWKFRYCDMRPGQHGGMDDRGSSRLPELLDRLGPTAHVLTYEQTHAELPPRRRRSLYLAPADQSKPRIAYKNALKAARKRGAQALLEFRLMLAAERKRKAALELVRQYLGDNQRLVLLTGRVKECQDLGRACKALPVVKKKQAPVQVVYGGLSQKARQAKIDQFMAEKGAGLIVATGFSLGTGFNLDNAHAAAFLFLPWSVDPLIQWEGRFHRKSTKHPVELIYVICEGTVDEHVASTLLEKLPAVGEITGDQQLAGAAATLSGQDPNESVEDRAQRILDMMEWDGCCP
jgi:superfamily II DNA or RNA helicase